MAKRKVPAPMQATLDVPVSFGNVGIGDEKARLGILIDRQRITLTKAETFLCNSRSEVRLHVDPNASGDQPGQEKMDFAKAEIRLEGVADVGRFGVGRKTISAGLTFAIGSTNVADLARFAKKSGQLVLNRIGDAGEGAEEDEGDEGTEEKAAE